MSLHYETLLKRVGFAASLAPPLSPFSSPQRSVSTDERQHHRQVIAIELSKLDNGADITDFSQYPGMPHICISRSFYIHENTYIVV